MTDSDSDGEIDASLQAAIEAVGARPQDMMDAGLLSGLNPQITVVRNWPSRVAVVVGARPDSRVVAALNQVGFNSVAASFPEAAETVRRVAPFAFLMLGPDVFETDASVEAVRAWHRGSPSARLKLCSPARSRDPEVLVRAIRAGVTDVIDPGDPEQLEAVIRGGMRNAGLARERVLAIGAHPDDVEIGCGGTLLDHRRRDDRVSILTLSHGAVGGDRRARMAEAAATADAIGAQLLFGDLPDTEIDAGGATVRLIESVVRALNPTVVYVHSMHDTHQDHRAVATATRSATRQVRRVFAYQSPSATNDFDPMRFVSVDDVLARKIEVLQLFASQDGRSYLEPELVTAAARYWARHLSASAHYAEPFEVIRSMGELRHSVTTPSLPAEHGLSARQSAGPSGFTMPAPSAASR